MRVLVSTATMFFFSAFSSGRIGNVVHAWVRPPNLHLRCTHPRPPFWISSRPHVVNILQQTNGKSTVINKGSVEDFLDENYFLSQVEETVRRVMSKAAHQQLESKDDILKLPPQEREALGVARILNTRSKALRRNNDCPRCWMQRAHCICDRCPPVETTSAANHTSIVRRIFLIMHHKEIGLKVDTAKLILSSFPQQARLVVGGISEEYQDSMKELKEAMEGQPDNCLVLFPDDTAQLYEEIQAETMANTGREVPPGGWDLIVLDGTWSQARKLHIRNIPARDEGGPRRIQLNNQDVAALATAEEGIANGHQLRRHCTSWRQVGTFEATRLCLRELLATEEDTASIPMWNQLESYQGIANQAARIELGPPQVRSKAK